MSRDSNPPKKSLGTVVTELGVAEETPLDRPISKSRVLELMKSDDIEVLGAVYKFVTNKGRSKAIRPSLQLEDYDRFMTHYYERCFREDPKGGVG